MVTYIIDVILTSLFLAKVKEVFKKVLQIVLFNIEFNIFYKVVHNLLPLFAYRYFS